MNRYVASSSHDRLMPPLWVLTITVAILFIYMLTQLSEIVTLLVVGYSLAYLVNPALTRLNTEWKIRRELGFMMVCGSIVLLVLLLGIFAAPTLLDEYDSLTSNMGQYMERLSHRYQPAIKKLQSYLPADWSDQDQLTKLYSKLPPLKGEVLAEASTWLLLTVSKGYTFTLTLINLLLLPFIVYYLAVGLPQLHSFIKALVPFRYRYSVVSVCKEIDGYIRAFVGGQVIVACILTVLYAIGLRIIGVELWFVLALITGLGNVIPYVGFMIGIVLSSLMALLTFGDFWHVVYVWIVYGVVQGLEGNLITPKIVGEKVGLSPLVVILAVVAGGKLFGLLGVFLAVPGAAVARVIMRRSLIWLVDRNVPA